MLSISRVAEIHARIPNTHLVMHGASSVPQDLIQIINDNGGQIPETYGVPVADIQKAIKSGVRKVNVDTDLRLAATAAVRQVLRENPEAFDPRLYNKAAQKAMQKICEERFESFGCAGRASDIQVKSMADMVSFYTNKEGA